MGLLALSTLGVVTLVLGAALVLFHSSWGQERIRRVAEAQLSAAIEGEVSIGSVMVDLRGQIQATDVRVRDVDGALAVWISHLTLDLRIRSLLGRRLVIESLRVSKFKIWASVREDGRINLVDLFARPVDEPTAARFPVLVESAILHDGRVDLDVVGERATIEDVAIVGSVAFTSVNTAVRVQNAHARWREGDVPLRLAGEVYGERQAWLASNVTLEALDSRLWARSVFVDTRTGGLAVDGRIRVSPAGIAVFCAHGPRELREQVCGWLAGQHTPDLTVDARIQREASGAPWHVRATGEARTALAYASAETSLHLDLVEETVHGSAVATISIHATPDAELPEPVRARIEAYAMGDRLVASIAAHGPQTSGFAWLRAHIEEGTPWIDKLEIRAELGDLAAVTLGALSGSAQIPSISARGPWNALDGKAQVELDQMVVHAADLRIRRALLKTRFTSLDPRSLPHSGSFSLQAWDVEHQRQRVDRLEVTGRVVDGARLQASAHAQGAGIVDSASLQVSVTREGRNISARLRKYAIVTGGVNWQGRNGHINARIGERVAIRDFALASHAGTIRVDGTFDARHPQRNELHLGVARLDLSRVNHLVALARPSGELDLRGRVNASVHLQHGRDHWMITADAAAHRVTWRQDVPRLSGELHVDLRDQRLVATADLSMRPRPGRATLTLATATPPDPFNVDAWRRLPPERIETLQAEVSEIDIPMLTTLTGASTAPVIAGILHATLTLDPLQPALLTTVRAEHLALRVGANLYQPFRAEITATWDGTRMSGRVLVDDRWGRMISAQAAVDVGLAELWAQLRADPLARIRNAPVEGLVEINAFDLRRVNASRTPVGATRRPRISGWLSSVVEIHGTVGDPQLILRQGVIERLGVNRVAISRINATGTLSRRQITIQASAVQERGGELRLSASYASGPDAALSGRVTVHAFDLATLRVLATRSTDPLARLSGRIDGDVSVSGTIAQPSVTGQLRLRHGQVWLENGGQRIHDATLDLTLEPGSITIRRLFTRIDQGDVNAYGRLTLDGYVPRSFRGNITARNIQIVTDGYTVNAWAGAHISATNERGTLDAQIQIGENARIELTPASRRLQRLGPLDDVVYVDTRRERRRERRAPSPAASLLPTVLRAQITAPTGIRVQSDDINATLRPTPQITLLFEDGDLTITGAIEVLRGTVAVLGRDYQIDYAVFGFVGPPANPNLNVRLSGEFSAATVWILISGTVESPTITLAANPPHDETTILAIMLDEDLTRSDTEEVLATGALRLGTVVMSRMRSKLPLPVDMVRTYSDGIMVGRWVTKNLLLGYRYRATNDQRKNTSEATIRWRFYPHWILDGHYGDRDIGGLDVLWQRRF